MSKFRQPSDFRALRLSEIPSQEASFDLYIEREGQIVPYKLRNQAWEPGEKLSLLQSSQFVLYFELEQEASVLREVSSDEDLLKSVSSTEFSPIIMDGIAEFLKARHALALSAEDMAFTRGLAVALSRYLTQQPRLRQLLEQLAAHDAYTYYHSMRTAAYAVALTDSKRTWELALGAVLHDIAYIFIPSALLNRRGPLSEDEWRKVRKHPEEGASLLQPLELSPLVLDLVLHHHERPDGQGYPHRMKAKDIAPEVRTLAFAEVFAALTAPRPYQPQHTPEQALRWMHESLSSYLDIGHFESLARLLELPQGWAMVSVS